MGNAPVICNHAWHIRGRGIAGIFLFSMQNQGICPALWGDFNGQSSAHIPAGKCEITPAGLGMSTASQLHGTAGAILSSKHCTLAPLCPCYPRPHRGRGYKCLVHNDRSLGVSSTQSVQCRLAPIKNQLELVWKSQPGSNFDMDHSHAY